MYTIVIRRAGLERNGASSWMPRTIPLAGPGGISHRDAASSQTPDRRARRDSDETLCRTSGVERSAESGTIDGGHLRRRPESTHPSIRMGWDEVGTSGLTTDRRARRIAPDNSSRPEAWATLDVSPSPERPRIGRARPVPARRRARRQCGLWWAELGLGCHRMPGLKDFAPVKGLHEA